MRSRLLLMSVLVVAVSSLHISAADDFSGSFTINGKTVPVRHVYALLHDNAEGVLPSPTQMRILITDREVSIDALYGLTFLPVLDLGRRDEVQGVLLQFDPTDPRDVDMTVLMPKGLQTVTDKVSVRQLKMLDGQVSGSVGYSDDSFASFPDYPKVKFSVRFNSRLHHPPAVTADLRDQEALNSPQVKALSAIADALAKADFAALKRLSSERANRRNTEETAHLGDKARTVYRNLGADLKRLIPGVKRVVVRGESAVVILPEESRYSLIFEDGTWKGD